MSSKVVELFRRSVRTCVRDSQAALTGLVCTQPVVAGRCPPAREGEGFLWPSLLGLATTTTQARHVSSSASRRGLIAQGTMVRLCAQEPRDAKEEGSVRQAGRALTDLKKVEKLVQAMKVVRGKLATVGANSEDDVADTRPLFRSDPRRLAEEAFQGYVTSALGECSRSRDDFAPGLPQTFVPLCAIHGASGTGKSTLLDFTRGWFAERFPTSKTLSITLDGHVEDTRSRDSESTPPRDDRVAHRLLHAAINARACPTATIDMLRSELGESVWGGDWFTDHTILGPALRMALGMGDDDHLLLTVDVVGRPDEENLPRRGARSFPSDIAYLRLLSQASFHLRTGEGVVLFVSAAVSASDLNATLASTSDSRIPLFLLPLPPVDPEPFFERACIKLDLGAEQHERRALVRRVLGDAAFNARCLETTYSLITGEQPTTITADFEAAKKVAVAGDLESIDASVGACMRMRVDKFLEWSKHDKDFHLFCLFRALFWPLQRLNDGYTFGNGRADKEKLRATIGGDALGVCAMVRQVCVNITEMAEFQTTFETISMHPRVCAMLCEALTTALDETQHKWDIHLPKRKKASRAWQKREASPEVEGADYKFWYETAVCRRIGDVMSPLEKNMSSTKSILQGAMRDQVPYSDCRNPVADIQAKLVRDAIKASKLRDDAGNKSLPIRARRRLYFNAGFFFLFFLSLFTPPPRKTCFSDFLKVTSFDLTFDLTKNRI